MTAHSSAQRAGALIVDKPAGISSHDVVGRIRKLAGTRKVGHGGTLDPMATGVLVVGLNRATRLLGHLQSSDKEYLATIRLGQTTVTDDAAGALTESADTSTVHQDAIDEAISGFSGEIHQVPSRVSAVKVGGRRSYDRVRAGEEVELAARPVTVWSFQRVAPIRANEYIDVDVRVVCSSGTYVRALARDVGAFLNVGGHLTALRRIRVGPFDIDQATGISTLETSNRLLPVIPVGQFAGQMFSRRTLDPDDAARVRHGARISAAGLDDSGPVALFDPNGEFLALYEFRRQTGRALAVFV